MHQTIKPVAGALVLSLILVACGGGGGSDSTVLPSSGGSSSSAASSAAVSSAAASSAAVSSAAASSAAVSSAAASSAAASSAAASSAAASSAAASSAAASSAAAVTWLPTYSVLSAQVASEPASGAYVNFNATTAAVTVGSMLISSPSAGALRLTNADGTLYYVQYNGNSVASLGAAGTQLSFDPATVRYLGVASVTSGSTISVDYTYGGSSSCTAACANTAVGIVDGSGNVLATKSDLYTLGSSHGTLTATANATGPLYVVFSRNGGEGGSVRVWSITH